MKVEVPRKALLEALLQSRCIFFLTMVSEPNLPKGEIVGLIPAGGQAIRLAPLPCSKELFPIGFRFAGEGHSLRPKVVSHYLMEKMKLAGVSKAYVILRCGKWDIPAYFGDGSMLDMHLAYLMLRETFGVPFTLDQAYPFVRHAMVAFGFPDILFDCHDPFTKLVGRQSSGQADVILGLFPATSALSREDRVELDDNGEVRDIILRPVESHLPYSWAIGVWRPSFTEFLHNYVTEKKAEAMQGLELSAGHAFQAAIKAGLKVEGLVVCERPYLDMGTPDDLYKAIRSSLDKPH